MPQRPGSSLLQRDIRSELGACLGRGGRAPAGRCGGFERRTASHCSEAAPPWCVCISCSTEVAGHRNVILLVCGLSDLGGWLLKTSWVDVPQGSGDFFLFPRPTPLSTSGLWGNRTGRGKVVGLLSVEA